MPDITMEAVHGERLRSMRPSVIMLPQGVMEPDIYCIPGEIADQVRSARMQSFFVGSTST